MKHIGTGLADDNCPEAGQSSNLRPSYADTLDFPLQLAAWDKDRLQLGYQRRSVAADLGSHEWNDSTSTWGTSVTTNVHPFSVPGQMSQGYVFTAMGFNRRASTGGLLETNARTFLPGSATSATSSLYAAGTSQQLMTSVAVKPSTGEGLLVYTGRAAGTVDYSTAAHQSDIHLLRSTNGGQTWSALTTVPGSARYGATVAYDKWRDVFIVGITGELYATGGTTPGRQLGFWVIPASTNTTITATYTQLSSASASPAGIACRDADWGCRIAWSDSSTYALRWARMRVSSTGAIETGSSYSAGWYGYETPSIVYFPGDDSYRLLFRQGPTTAYARRLLSSGSSWTGLPDVYNSSSRRGGAPSQSVDVNCFFGSCNYTLRAWITHNVDTTP